jgi:hypothetical protein
MCVWGRPLWRAMGAFALERPCASHTATLARESARKLGTTKGPAGLSGGGLGDQPLSALDLPEEWEISAEEFEKVWQRMLAARNQQ